MKKNHKREIFIARVTFAIFLVVVALIVALIVMLVSSHLRKKDAEGNKQQTPVTKDVEPATEKVPDVVAPTTEGIIEDNDTQSTEPEEDTQNSSTSRWTTDSVRFRVEPNTDCDVITGLSKGTEVEYISEDNGWTKVKFNGKTGYVSSEYLTATAP